VSARSLVKRVLMRPTDDKNGRTRAAGDNRRTGDRSHVWVSRPSPSSQSQSQSSSSSSAVAAAAAAAACVVRYARCVFVNVLVCVRVFARVCAYVYTRMFVFVCLYLCVCACLCLRACVCVWFPTPPPVGTMGFSVTPRTTPPGTIDRGEWAARKLHHLFILLHSSYATTSYTTGRTEPADRSTLARRAHRRRRRR